MKNEEPVPTAPALVTHCELPRMRKPAFKVAHLAAGGFLFFHVPKQACREAATLNQAPSTKNQERRTNPLSPRTFFYP
ncbi:hypothetical protein [Desulfoluna sp.]|uniref:hypothetical protein n=1 Tax=Desulfoluna sp. TaxID=2045199 RepID=UPI002619472C|nr:hypothetical protein [Desulfoluna sp.]